jgi:hypothetical protein
MKTCPECGRVYADENVTSCFVDGAQLVLKSDSPAAEKTDAKTAPVRPQPQPIQTTPVQPQSHPKSNKKLWIILSVVLGLVVLTMGSCVACVAILNSAGSNSQQGRVRRTPLPLPQIEDISYRLDEGIFSHDVYFSNEGSRDLHEVNISISLTGETGEQKSETRYFAIWTTKQAQKISFQVGNSPRNVQKITIKGSCKEGEINLSFAPKNQRVIEITVINEDCTPSDFYVDDSLVMKIAANSSARLRLTTGVHRMTACLPGNSCRGQGVDFTFTEETKGWTITRSPNCP